jgi:hypothetical protein
MELAFNFTAFDREDASGFSDWISTIQISGPDAFGRTVPIFVEDGTLPLLRTAAGEFVLTNSGEYVALPVPQESPLMNALGSTLINYGGNEIVLG